MVCARTMLNKYKVVPNICRARRARPNALMIWRQNAEGGSVETIHTMPWTEMALRLGCAVFAGALVGMEREHHGRAAGLRTTILVCVAASMAMIMSEVLFIEASAAAEGGWRPDPARLAAGILTGMGFLGAGVVMKEGRVVRGVTTAAALWFTTIIGLAFGGGLYLLGSAGVAVAILTLFLLPVFGKRIRNDWYGSVQVTLKMEGATDLEVKAYIEQLGVTIKDVELDYNVERQQRTILCRIKYKKSDVFELSTRVVSNIISCDGVIDVRWV